MRQAERVAWAVGLVCLTAWGALTAESRLGARQELRRFAGLQAAALAQDLPPLPAEPSADALRASLLQTPAEPDLRLWDRMRVASWRASLRVSTPPPLAVLGIPRLALTVPVLPGTNELVLNRGVGHIDGTALPGADGNLGIAGHRDGFFRGLKDLVLGDDIEVVTLAGKEVYRVDRMWVVEPEDVYVLDATPVRSLTLVTCYPFYYLGSAPQRFIVRAVLAGETEAIAGPSR